MAKGTTIRMWKRSLTVLVALIICFGLMISRLFYLQVITGESLEQRAIDQQLKDTTINAQRGTIYDCNMKPLAQSATVWTVVLEPAYLKDGEQKELVATGLSQILEMDKDKILEKASQHSYYTIIKRKVENDVKEKISKFKADNKIENGIRLVEDYKRYYPYGDFASAVIGFTGSDSQGLAGVEAYYDKYLTGQPGKLVTAKNARGTDMPFDYEQLIQATNGYNLVLSIDETIQHLLEKNLEEGIITHKVKNRAAAIVMDVNTGAVLGMAVKDGFDLNDPFAIANEETRQKIEALPEEEQAAAKAEALNQQWRNKAVSDTYYPGSVFKMFTTSMGLEENLISEDSTFTCAGSYRPYEGARALGCNNRAGHGTINLVKAVCVSCNPAFIQIGQKVGAEKFYDYYSAFGFSEKTGIDLPGEMKDIFFSQDGSMAPMDLAVASFGQNFSITPIQMITAMCSIANGGNLVEPHVVSKITDSDGNIVKSIESKIKRSVISKRTAERVSSMLYENTLHGGGTLAYVEGYKVAGKTGTSEKIGISSGEGMDYIASYGGFVPADKPQIAMLVFFDTPKGDTYYGGTVAAPVFANVMKEILPYLGIERQYTEEEMAKLDTSTPDVSGKSVGQAKAALESEGLKATVMGSGDSVISQMPDAGKRISKGGKVVLYTDKDSSDSTVVVPNLLGKSVSTVNSILAEANLNLKISGTYSGEGDIIAKTQSISEGTQVPAGTIITVGFSSNSQLD